MLRTVQMVLLFIAGAFLVFSTSCSAAVPLNAQVSNSTVGAVTEPTVPEQRTRRPSSISEPVEVVDNVYMEDIDEENQTFTPVPMIVLKRGQTYRVEQRYKDNKPATSRAGFSKWHELMSIPINFGFFRTRILQIGLSARVIITVRVF